MVPRPDIAGPLARRGYPVAALALAPARDLLPSGDVTALQQGLAHLVLTVCAIVAATVLAVTGHIDGTDALAIIVAAAGIGGTGVAGVATVVNSAKAVSPSVVKPASPPAPTG